MRLNKPNLKTSGASPEHAGCHFGGCIAILQEDGAKCVAYGTTFMDSVRTPFGACGEELPRHSRFFLDLPLARLFRPGGSERLTNVDNQERAPTRSIAIAHTTGMLVEGVLAGQFGVTKEWAGVHHMTCCSVVGWCGFAQAIPAHTDRLLNRRSPHVVPIPTSEYSTSRRRPWRCCEKLARVFEVRLHYREAALDIVD